MIDPIDIDDISAPIQAQLYEKRKKVGEGTYAVVYEGIIKSTQRKIAIKKIKLSQQASGIDLSALREIKTLHELHHPNVIELIDVYAVKMNLNLVLEYLDTDLERLVKDKHVLITPADIKSWMGMLFRGLEYCHRNWVLHRVSWFLIFFYGKDLKPNNLLIAPDGQLKLADFGLAREYGSPGGCMSSVVVTR